MLKQLKGLEKGTEARKLYDCAVRATTCQEFANAMTALQAIKPDVFNYLRKIGYDKFAEAMLPDGVASHLQRTNNLAEQQMAWLGDLRAMPAVPFIASLIEKLMKKYGKESSEYFGDIESNHKVSYYCLLYMESFI
jgi:hypothetical protein